MQCLVPSHHSRGYVSLSLYSPRSHSINRISFREEGHNYSNNAQMWACFTFTSLNEKTQKKWKNKPVKAFMNVDSDLVNILKKGSLTGNFSEPHSAVCSRMCGTPVSSRGVVRKATLEQKRREIPQPKHGSHNQDTYEKTLFESSLATWRCSAPVSSWRSLIVVK